jgi:4-hydroxybenzoyl-CoA reductase subunit beta
MLLPDHRYVKAESLEECLKILRESGDKAKVIAGGTDVIFNMRLKLFQPDIAVSIRGLKDLQQVEELDDGSVRLGAACRLADLIKHPLAGGRYPVFKQALEAVASTHIRNMGTLGGNICLETRCWYTNNSDQWREGLKGCYKTDDQLCHVIKGSTKCHAINNSDTPPALIVLGAVLTLQKAGASRDVPIAEFYRTDGIDFTVLAAGEIVTHVTIPPVSDRQVFIKIAPRKGMDFSLGAIAVRCDGEGDQLTTITMVMGSLVTAPVILEKPAQIVLAAGLTDAAIEEAAEHVREELGQVTNLFGRSIYKKQIAAVLVKRALQSLREQ